MSDLSSRERALVEAARQDWGPSERAPLPSASAIQKRLADKPWLAVPVASLAPPGSKSKASRLFGMTSAAIGVCALALVGFVGLSSMEAGRERAAATPVNQTALAAPIVEAAETPATVVPSVAIDSLPDAPAPLGAPKEARDAKKAPERAAAESSPADVLREEIALIRAAQGHLRAGAPDRALASLSVHASRFPGGVLRDERMTLQVLALCERGEVDAARAVKSELERSSPGSSHLQRLASSCAR